MLLSNVLTALSFDAYFQESVHERREEQYRIRRCKILFYPEDDTVQIVEPRIANTGISQGTIVKRHRINKPPPNDHLYYTVYDFNVGTEFIAYGKTFRIVACDQFTSNFLRKLGVRLGEPEPIPDDPYSIHRKAFTESMQPLRPYERMDKLRQFLDHDRHVLRFFCFWDDTESLYGDPREMILNYFLADDTIEIREIIPANSGRDAVPCFLRRQKLPRSIAPIPLPGVVTDRTLLNVFGHSQKGGHYVLDSLKLGAPKDDFYKDHDLTIGAKYYRIKYGLHEFTPVKPKLPDTRIPVKREIPPYNGWGTEEDSLANCFSLIPTAPNHNFKQFMELDRQGIESHILRFAARLLSERPVDRERQFVISCYLSDDTISIYEPQQKNSGFKGGLFLERSKIKKPGTKLFNTKPSEYYKPTDLYVGTILDFNTFLFELIEADNYTLDYMEKNDSQFTKSNHKLILDKLRPLIDGKCDEMLKYAVNQDPDNTGTFGFNQMKCLIDQLTGKENALTTHELGTLARYYGVKSSKSISQEVVLGIAQQTLRRQAFEDFSSLLFACRQQDSEKTGEIDRQSLRRICLAHHLPLPDDMLHSIMDYLANENGLIQYELFMNQLNWKCPTTEGMSIQVPCDYTGNVEIDWLSVSKGDAPKSLGLSGSSKSKVERVNYKYLINDLCGIEEKCT
ncbi:unnamed protein product [Heterobilharzia americana]|nr:unnamed protein product [Heterobilharzia americana]